MLTTPPLHAAAHPLPRAAAWPFGPSSHPCPSVCRRHAGNTSVVRWSHVDRTPIAHRPRFRNAAAKRRARRTAWPSAIAHLQGCAPHSFPLRPVQTSRRAMGPFHSAVQARHTSSSPLKRVRTPVARAGTSHPRLSSPARARRAQRAACHPRLSVPHSPSLPRPPPSRAFAHAPCGANARPTNRSHVRARPSSDVSRETSVPAV